MAVIDATGLFPSSMLAEMIAGFLSGETDERWLTLEQDGGPVAIAYCAPERMAEGTWNLPLIAVDPDRQGIGLGGALMGQVEDALRADGQRLLLVETSGEPEFERTRKFYRQLAYIEEARIRDYYSPGDDKIVFWKKL